MREKRLKKKQLRFWERREGSVQQLTPEGKARRRQWRANHTGYLDALTLSEWEKHR
jgi:hypothetical protein